MNINNNNIVCIEQNRNSYIELISNIRHKIYQEGYRTTLTHTHKQK